MLDDRINLVLGDRLELCNVSRPDGELLLLIFENAGKVRPVYAVDNAVGRKWVLVDKDELEELTCKAKLLESIQKLLQSTR